LDGPLTIAGGKTNANHIADFGVGMLGANRIVGTDPRFCLASLTGARTASDGLDCGLWPEAELSKSVLTRCVPVGRRLL